MAHNNRQSEVVMKAFFQELTELCNKHGVDFQKSVYPLHVRQQGALVDIIGLEGEFWIGHNYGGQ